MGVGYKTAAKRHVCLLGEYFIVGDLLVVLSTKPKSGPEQLCTARFSATRARWDKGRGGRERERERALREIKWVAENTRPAGKGASCLRQAFAI